MLHDDYTSLLYDFVDGSLEQQQEELLFAEMSTNHELRNELKELLVLNGALQSDVKALVPPVESTMKIFSTLGYTAPIAAIGAATASAHASSSGALASAFTKAGTYIGGYIHALVSGVILTATSLGLLWGTDVIEFSSQTNSAVAASQQQQKDQRESLSLIEKPIIKEQTIADTRNTVKETVRYVYISSPIQQSSGNRVSENKESVDQVFDNQNSVIQTDPMISATQESATITTTEILPNSSAQSPMDSWGNSTQVQVNNGPLSLPYGGTYDNISQNSLSDEWTVHFRRLDMQAANNHDPMPQSGIFPFNGAVTALYTVSPDIALGLEVGYERFAQTFQSVNTQNQRVEIYQQPSLLTGGLALRYTPLHFESITPFVQTSLGFSQIGMVNRASVGFMYAPNQTLSFTLGFESSMVRYKEKSTSYSSFNYGLSYGIAVHL